MLSLDCVPISTYCKETGETPDAINKRIQRGVWREGVQVLKVEGVKERWIDLSMALKGFCMEIPDDLFPGLKDHVGPVLIYFDSGTAKRGFPLRKDEFVTSLKSLDEACKKAGLPPVIQD